MWVSPQMEPNALGPRLSLSGEGQAALWSEAVRQRGPSRRQRKVWTESPRPSRVLQPSVRTIVQPICSSPHGSSPAVQRRGRLCFLHPFSHTDRSTSCSADTAGGAGTSAPIAGHSVVACVPRASNTCIPLSPYPPGTSRFSPRPRGVLVPSSGWVLPAERRRPLRPCASRLELPSLRRFPCPSEWSCVQAMRVSSCSSARDPKSARNDTISFKHLARDQEPSLTAIFRAGRLRPMAVPPQATSICDRCAPNDPTSSAPVQRARGRGAVACNRRPCEKLSLNSCRSASDAC